MQPFARLSMMTIAGLTALATSSALGQSDDAVYRTASPEEWREDLSFLASELPLRAPDVFGHVSPAEFQRNLEALANNASGLEPDAMLMNLARELAKLEDGHTGLLLDLVNGLGEREYPFELWRVNDGIVIVGVTGGREDLLGAKILEIDGTPVEQAVKTVWPLIPRDHANVGGGWSDVLSYFESPDVLRTCGIAAQVDQLRMLIEDSTGQVREIEIPAMESGAEAELVRSAGGSEPALWQRNVERWLWFRSLPENNATYIQFNSADVGRGAEEDAFRERCDELEQHLVESRPEKVVVDLRRNGGGNSVRTRHLLHALIRAGYTRERGKLFVLTSWRTFSAGVTHCVNFEQHADPIFVGEPTGGRPNDIGELRRFRLPNTDIQVRYSAVMHHPVGPGDYRPAVMPDLRVSMSTADIRAGRDPALEAVFRYTPRPSGLSEIKRILNEIPASQALAACKELVAEWFNEFEFDDVELNVYGYGLLGDGRIDEAIVVFELILDWMPYHPNSHDSVADAYRAAGRLGEAIEHYQIAFDMDKRYAHVPDTIRELRKQIDEIDKEADTPR